MNLIDIKIIIRRIINKSGYDVIKLCTIRRKKLLDSYEINTILDVGANIGIYAGELRNMGYQGKIISFEPLSAAYSQLLKNKKTDALWTSFNIALGDKDGEAILNIANNSCSSSILSMLPTHLQSAPESKYIGREQVKLSTIDTIFDSLCVEGQNIWLKIDTQGFEKNVLKGAEKSLRLINTIQLEMSLIPLYSGELLFTEMFDFLCGKGYLLVSVEQGFADPQTGRVLQIEGTFHRF